MIETIAGGLLSSLPLIAVGLGWIGYRKDSQRLKLFSLPLLLIGLAWWSTLLVRHFLNTN